MIAESFLICSLALGGLSYHHPHSLPIDETTFHKLVQFLTQRKEPVLYLEIRRRNILIVHNKGEHWYQGDYRQLPFDRRVFDVVIRKRQELEARGLKEISRVLKRRGFFVMHGLEHHDLIKSFNFILLPIRWENDYFIYRKNGSRKYRKKELEGSA